MENSYLHKDPFFEFLDGGKTPWHVVALIEKSLKDQGFTELSLKNPFQIERGKSYLVKKEGTLIAFRIPEKEPEKILFAASHTDSPTLKLKPKPTLIKGSQTFLSVEVYGSPLYSSFFNRDLAIAGNIYYEKEGTLNSLLIDLQEFPVIIPQLALHLDREANEKGRAINPETHLHPLMQGVQGDTPDLLKHLETLFSIPPILGHDLFLYPLEKATALGFDHDLFASARIDNLGSAFALWKGFEKSTPKEALQMALFWNHEEVGSGTAEGAASPLFLEILERIRIALSLNEDWLFRMRHRSFGLSVDEAHATHMSYPDKHDVLHEVKLGEGVTIKSNAKKRYSTEGSLIASLKILCKKHHIPIQEFINRSDIPCGSTIGPVLSTASGFQIIDIGCPELSMHSAREVGSLRDHESMIRLIEAYFNS